MRSCRNARLDPRHCVKEKFGIEVSRQCVEAHHPERRAGAKLNLALRALFYETRAKLWAELDDIGIAC